MTVSISTFGRNMEFFSLPGCSMMSTILGMQFELLAGRPGVYVEWIDDNMPGTQEKLELDIDLEDRRCTVGEILKVTSEKEEKRSIW